MVGHSGDTPCAPLVEYGLPPPNEKERLKVIQRMAAHTQFCMSGDHTLEATREAIEEVATHLDEADEAFVFVLSDANLERCPALSRPSAPRQHPNLCGMASTPASSRPPPPLRGLSSLQVWHRTGRPRERAHR